MANNNGSSESIESINAQLANATFEAGLPSAALAAAALTAAEQISDDYAAILALRQMAPTWDDGIRSDRTRRMAARDAARLASPRTLATLASL